MHPAKSVIFFTTIYGAGFGLIALLALTGGMGHISWDKAGRWRRSGWCWRWPGWFPQLFIWVIRSAPGGVQPVAVQLAVTRRRVGGDYLRAVRAVGCRRYDRLYPPKNRFCGGRFMCADGVCHAMIYAQPRPVPRWHSWLTPASYLGFSLSSGMLLMVMPSAL